MLELLTKDITERIRALRDSLLTGMVERDEAVRLALLAALSGEHLLLVGPPGTAKSMIARRLHLAFEDATYFERLLTRFTVPEELFGPLSIKGLEEDRYERLTEAYLPNASVAFLDEIFKANSAILNALLTLLNEREFDNGALRVKTPLIAVIGASNELPEGAELDALYDRFLLRLHVGPVSSAAFPALLSLSGEESPSIPKKARLKKNDLVVLQRSVDAVELPEDVVALLASLRQWCAAEAIQVSDRRWRKIVKLLRVSALTNGRRAVSPWDCWLLQHCTWREPEEREKIFGWYSARVGASSKMDTSRTTKIVVSWEARLKADQDSRTQMTDEEGRLMYRAADGTPTPEQEGNVRAMRGDEPLFLAPSRSHDGHRWIRDRTNRDRGYTEADLDQMSVGDDDDYNPRRFAHWEKRGEYLADRTNWLYKEGFLPPFVEPTRHKDVYLDACLAELSNVKESFSQYLHGLKNHASSLHQEIASHLWVLPRFAKMAEVQINNTGKEVADLQARLERVEAGYSMLPRESWPRDNPSESEEQPPVGRQRSTLFQRRD